MPRRSELFTEDPFYLPRYCGYLPQYKYRIGKTYGRHSVEILSDDGVHKSGKYVLSATDPLPVGGVDERRVLLRSRTDSVGNQLITDAMVPGYTGYIPKRQHYYANTYGEVCRSALSHHEMEQQEGKHKRQKLKKIFALQNGSLPPTSQADRDAITARHTTPLLAIAKDVTYHSPQEFRPYGSPYILPNDNEMKWFKSGYTGFVPRTRELFALGYPVQSNQGLKTFTDSQGEVRGAAKKDAIPPLSRPKLDTSRLAKTTIYPPNRGMVPHYTGYIPGYKYQIGHTYGQHTLNTLKLPNGPLSTAA